MSAALPGTLRSRALKLGALLGVAGLSAAACAPTSNPPSVPIKQQGTVLVNVVDSLFDAGRSPSVQLDKDGNPVVSYLLYKPVLKKGEIPPAIKPGDPQPPSVMLATLSKGIWTRTSVTPQKTSPASGTATEIADKNGYAIPGATTSLALDAQGKHHVAWATPSGLFYSTDAGGLFSSPDKITGSASFGGSIAVAQDGTVWVSFYSGGSLRVAHRTGGKWTVDEVQKSAGPAATPATVSAIRVGSNGDPIVAYGDHGATKVAIRSGGGWKTERIGALGGYGVSLALENDGSPNVTYYDARGVIEMARPRGGSRVVGGAFFASRWEVIDLGSVTPHGQPDARWSTDLAIDDQGVTYVTWTDTNAGQIMLSSAKAGGDFKAQPVQGSLGGANPGIAVSPDGKKQAIAWFDSTNANLDVASTSSGGLVLAHPLPTLAPPTATVGPTAPTPPCQPSGSSTTLQIAAPAGAAVNGFDKTCLAVAAGKDFTVDFANNDPPNLHNWALFADSSGTKQLGGGTISQPVPGGQTQSYSVKALPAGQYFYRCDFHPTTMTGTFVVAKS
jgi:plastocyanin